MRTCKLLFIVAAFFLANTSVFSQNWQLVWADEFTNGISSDWVFETGAGGWGNNELQYYRRENASVQNGQLVISAKKESFGGANYTSVRMKTQGKKSWKFGRIEARIATPSFQGVWPAFWMLGDNISSVGWPSCGEIDIMEHVNTGGEVRGTIHWANSNGSHAEYGGGTSTDITNYHTYAVEWDANSIKWFVDGNLYHSVNIANNINSTDELHNNFFILLNLAIGGNWPGFTVNNNGFPANMYVDYVRVYQNTGVPLNPGVTNLSGSYQLQNRFSGQFLDVNAASTSDGARIQQWTNTGCVCQNFRFTHLGGGIYSIIADHSGKSLDVSAMSTVDGAPIVQWPYWGGDNQKFKVVSTGDGFYKLIAVNSGKLIEVGGWSNTPGGIVQQWADNNQSSGQWRLIPAVASFNKTIQAEDFSAMLGVQKEATTDAGGGENVGYIDNGDWLAYNAVNFPTSGTYTIEYRVASLNGGNRLSLDLNAGSIQLGALNIPSTGGWQNWVTVSQTVNVNAGIYNLGIYAVTGGFNLNWIKITKVNNARLAEADNTNGTNSSTVDLEVFPNPTDHLLNISTIHELNTSHIKILDLVGNVILENRQTLSQIDVSLLKSGIYTVELILEDNTKIIKRFVKQ